MSWFNKTTDHLAQILALEKRIEAIEKEQLSYTSQFNMLENRIAKQDENVKGVALDTWKQLLDLQQKIEANISVLDNQILTTFSKLTDTIQNLEKKIQDNFEQTQSTIKSFEVKLKVLEDNNKPKPNFVLPKKKMTE